MSAAFLFWMPTRRLDEVDRRSWPGHPGGPPTARWPVRVGAPAGRCRSRGQPGQRLVGAGLAWSGVLPRRAGSRIHDTATCADPSGSWPHNYVHRRVSASAGPASGPGGAARQREFGPLVALVGLVVVEPVLARLEALDERVPGRGGVRWRAGTARCRSSRCARTARTGAGAATSRRRRVALDAAFPARRSQKGRCAALSSSSTPPPNRAAAGPGTGCRRARTRPAGRRGAC